MCGIEARECETNSKILIVISGCAVRQSRNRITWIDGIRFAKKKRTHTPDFNFLNFVWPHNMICYCTKQDDVDCGRFWCLVIH